MFNKEKLVEVLGKIEGHKTRLKELHWSSPSRSMHVIIDDFSSELAEFEDALAENSIALLDFVYPGDLSPELPEETDFESDLEAIREDLEMWKNEINEKIDEVNNYLMGLIRDLDDRVTSLEGRVSDLEERMTTAEEDIDALEGRMDTAEDDIDALEGRMDTAEDDIDDLEQNKQDKLTAGFGIEIDSNNEISVDTNDVQEKLIAGKEIDITNNVISNAQGCYNMGQLTTFFNGDSFMTNLVQHSGILYHHEQGSLATYRGIFVNSNLGALPSNSNVVTHLQNFESDFEIIIRKVIWISDKNVFDPTQSSGIIYYRKSQKKRIKCTNGVIEKETNFTTYSGVKTGAYLLHLHEADNVYVPLGKDGNGLYVHCAVIFDIIQSSKQFSEWESEIAAIKNLTNGANILIGDTVAYGAM